MDRIKNVGCTVDTSLPLGFSKKKGKKKGKLKLVRKRNLKKEQQEEEMFTAIETENRRLLQRSGFVVWLRTSVAHQLHRLGRDRSRPLLQTPNRDQLLERMARERNPLYTEVADLVFDASHRNVKQVAARLCEDIQDHWQPPQNT